MKTMIKRLKLAKQDREVAWGREILKKELAKAAGVSSPAVTNWWNNENTELEARCVFGLAKFLGISAEWLQSGRGQMLAPYHIPGSGDPSIRAPREDLIKEIPTNLRNSISGDGSQKPIQNVTPAAPDQRRIPVISYVQAGMMTEVVDPFALGDGFETILTDLDVSEQTFALIIDGPSMLPEFNEGDKVIIDPALQPRPGDFVVAKNTSEEATFKKYRPRGTNERGDMVFELVPLNDDFPTLNSERDHLHIIGVMVEHRKYRRR